MHTAAYHAIRRQVCCHIAVRMCQHHLRASSVIKASGVEDSNPSWGCQEEVPPGMGQVDRGPCWGQAQRHPGHHLCIQQLHFNTPDAVFQYSQKHTDPSMLQRQLAKLVWVLVLLGMTRLLDIISGMGQTGNCDRHKQIVIKYQ